MVRFMVLLFKYLHSNITFIFKHRYYNKASTTCMVNCEIQKDKFDIK